MLKALTARAQQHLPLASVQWRAEIEFKQA